MDTGGGQQGAGMRTTSPGGSELSNGTMVPHCLHGVMTRRPDTDLGKGRRQVHFLSGPSSAPDPVNGLAVPLRCS